MKRTSCTSTAALLALMAVACTDRGLPTEVTRVTPVPVADMVDGQYPTEGDYLAAGGSTSGVLGIDWVSGGFTDGLSNWNVAGQYHYQFVNDLDFNLMGQVLLTSGGTVNSSTSADGWHVYLPTLLSQTQNVAVDVSTNNNLCGITGKGSLSLSGDLKLADGKGGR